MLVHPQIDPIAFSIGPLAVRWYGLMYLAGFAAGWWLGVRRIAAGAAPVTRRQFDDLLFLAVLGVILGGRLGYVLFYKPAHYLANPLEIFAIWQGGMSFHGGLVGVAAGVIAFSSRNGLPILSVGDAVAAAAPIGLFFGRLANFINAELWGKPSTAPWAVVFPGEAAQACPEGWVGPCARHPSQLYEAGLEGVVLFVALALAIRAGALRRPGWVFGLMLVGYAAARLFVEQFRQADGQFVSPANPHGHVLRLGAEWGLTMGQLLSLPMLVVGLVLLVRAVRARAA
jgi:phosphatidylglycerol---prolipoprotein diacylglyceryl transferase